MPRLPVVLAALALALAACDDGASYGTPRATPPVKGATASFSAGVAAGDVTPGSAVLWTRAEGGDAVTVEVSTDASFARDVRTAGAVTSAERDFTVKAKVTGLRPATAYRYRFRAGDATSPAGSFTTAPEPSQSAPLRFVFSGDSDGSHNADGTPRFNNFEVLDAAAAEQPAFFLYFGDTIYADSAPRAKTLDAYRAKYRENRGYRALTDILAAAATYNTWDDHEVVNDFAGTTIDRAMLEAGRRAFREYMPIDDAGDPARLYRSFRWGKDVELIILDERSFRDAPAVDACNAGERADPLPGAGAPSAPGALRGIRTFVGLPEEPPAGCLTALDEPSRTMLGDEQKRFLLDRLAASDATWKVVVNEVPVQMLLFEPYDRWEGYAAERREVLRFIRDEGIRNVVFLTTDFHANIFGPVRIDAFTDPEPVAYEAVAGPIATTPLRADIVAVAGEAGADALPALATGLLGADCAVLDAYAYGLVEVDPAAGTLTITAKDATGRELCKKRLEAQR